ncbi:MAG: Asp23/Gls24 family envelope stress response protein [Firmicutes bacterium]|nr:Asp23/Gls24 family envelope stress response protein [Bacillota bacterium]
MSTVIFNNNGMIEINKDVIGKLAGIAVTQCFGIIGMVSSRKISDGLSDILGRDALSKGVEVISDKNTGLVIRVNVVVCYGTNISMIAANIMENVKFTVEKYTKLKVASVDVNIAGVRVLD